MAADNTSENACLGDKWPINAMTVDVEDYFQVSLFEQHVDRKEWDHKPCRVVENMDKILACFSDYGVRATFFMLGWIAERFPDMVRRLTDEGHELASHGYAHVRVTCQARDEFRRDVVRTKTILEDISGVEVRGYRAASYSINDKTPWAYDVLREAGYQYSSSIYPIRHDLYGMPDAPRFPFPPGGAEGIVEIPVSTAMLAGRRIPCGGGGYFRLYPYAFSKWVMRRINRIEARPCVFYFHPWELDPDQPRPPGLPLKTRFRHYINLGRMELRLRRLLDDFRWDRMDRVFSSCMVES